MMLSVVASAAHSLLDHETAPYPLFSFPDMEFASWEFPDLVSESNQTSPNSVESNHGSIHSTEPVTDPGLYDLDLTERKLKRMKSNRESARRSRMRKQKHLDNLRTEANRLNYTNRELSNRLRFAIHSGLTLRFENQRLRTEHSMLRQRLIELQNVMIFRQIQQINNHKNEINVGGFGYGSTRLNEPMGI